MTPDRIAELRALMAKASPAPWEIEQDQEGGFMVCGMTIAQTARPEQDAAFIAAARTALPEALDAIERVRETAPCGFYQRDSNTVCGRHRSRHVSPTDPGHDYTFPAWLLAALEGKSE